MQTSPTSSSIPSWLSLLIATLRVAVGLLVLGVVFCVTANVFGRFVLNTSYAWAEEMSRVLFIWLVLLGAGLGSLEREHVAVTFFRDMAPQGLKRLLSLAVIALIYLVCLSIGLGFHDLISGYVSETPMLGISKIWLYSAMLVMGGLTLIANTLALVDVLRGRDQ